MRENDRRWHKVDEVKPEWFVEAMEARRMFVAIIMADIIETITCMDDHGLRGERLNGHGKEGRVRISRRS
jgi:hypothetical protein